MKTEVAFRKWQKNHYNFVTPKLLRVRVCKDIVVELSEGTDMEHKPLFGVSLFRHLSTAGFRILKEGDLELNRCFGSRAAATEYLQALVLVLEAIK